MLMIGDEHVELYSAIMMMAEPGKMQFFCDKSAIIITKVSTIAKMII